MLIRKPLTLFYHEGSVFILMEFNITIGNLPITMIYKI